MNWFRTYNSTYKVIRLIVFSFLLVFMAHYAYNAIEFVSNSNDQCIVDFYEHDGGEEENNSESEDEVKEIDDYVFATGKTNSSQTRANLGNSHNLNLYQDHMLDIDSPPPIT